MGKKKPEREIAMTITDTDGTEMILDLLSWRISERIALKKFLDMNREQIIEAVFGDDPEVERFLYWLARERSGKPFVGTFNNLDFETGDQPGQVNFRATPGTEAFLESFAGSDEDDDPTQPPSTQELKT